VSLSHISMMVFVLTYWTTPGRCESGWLLLSYGLKLAGSTCVVIRDHVIEPVLGQES
jgi:hypothetical protein